MHPSKLSSWPTYNTVRHSNDPRRPAACVCTYVQVMADTESAESVFAEAKEATLESKAALSQQRTDLALLQREFRESSRREEQASIKIKEVLTCVQGCWTFWFRLGEGSRLAAAPSPPIDKTFHLKYVCNNRKSTTPVRDIAPIRWGVCKSLRQ